MILKCIICAFISLKIKIILFHVCFCARVLTFLFKSQYFASRSSYYFFSIYSFLFKLLQNNEKVYSIPFISHCVSYFSYFFCNNYSSNALKQPKHAFMSFMHHSQDVTSAKKCDYFYYYYHLY